MFLNMKKTWFKMCARRIETFWVFSVKFWDFFYSTINDNPFYVMLTAVAKKCFIFFRSVWLTKLTVYLFLHLVGEMKVFRYHLNFCKIFLLFYWDIDFTFIAGHYLLLIWQRYNYSKKTKTSWWCMAAHTLGLFWIMSS